MPARKAPWQAPPDHTTASLYITVAPPVQADEAAVIERFCPRADRGLAVSIGGGAVVCTVCGAVSIGGDLIVASDEQLEAALWALLGYVEPEGSWTFDVGEVA